MNGTEIVRRRVLYAGNVQGVGFRYTIQHIAQSYAVTGFVRNLSDGRVELVAEGEPPVVEAFVAQVASTMARYIRGAESADLPPTGEWKSFTIAR